MSESSRDIPELMETGDLEAAMFSSSGRSGPRWSTIFAPASQRRHETDEDHRNRLFMQVLLALNVNFIALLLIFYLAMPTYETGRQVGGTMLGVILGGIVSITFVFTRWGLRQLCVNLLLTMISAILIVGSFWTGGADSPALVGLLTIPVLASTLTSPRWGYFWTTIAIAAWLSLVSMEYAGMEFQDVTKQENVPLAHALAMMGSLLLIMAVLGSYIRSNQNLRLVMAEKNQRLDFIASYDDLTGISNRRFFFEEAQRCLLRSRRSGKPMALLVIDLRKFKQVNDHYGHSVGDELLKAFAEHLRKGFRETDFAGRLGGDEFGVLLTDVADEAAVQLAIDRFRGTPAETVTVDGVDIHCDCDIGSALYPRDGDNLPRLYDAADSEMYANKRKAQ